ncbi:MAG: protein kinase, partial [Anaerolineae bacterium]|nr:protein kinase [Anaerolineae bacterium]
MTKSNETSSQQHDYKYKNGDAITSRYIVVKPLGYGGFAEVYHCKHATLHNNWAIKVITTAGMSTKEALAAAQLEHPNIIKPIDVTTSDDNTPIIVFQYVNGITLKQKL